MAKETKLIAHPKYLLRLTLRSENDIDETVTRLSYFTRQELENFFRPLVDCGSEIGWRNAAEFPQEARLFRLALESVAEGSANNRDNLLFALAQIVSGNLPEVVKAYRRAIGTSFYKIIAKGVMPIEEYYRMLGEAQCVIGEGLFALCRISLETADATIPNFVREAMGIMSAAVVMPAKPAPVVAQPMSEESVPASETGLAPSVVGRLWKQARFVRELSEKDSVQAGDIKAFAGMSAIPPLPGENAPDVKRAASSAKIFLMVQEYMDVNLSVGKHDAEASDFPQCLRVVVNEIGRRLAMPLVLTGALHLGGVSYGFDSQALKEFYSRIGARLRECTPGKWYNVKDTLDDIVYTFGEFKSMVSRYGSRIHNTYRQTYRGSYLMSHPDNRLDLELPLARLFFSTLALFGIVTVGVGREPTKQQRYSQFDSVECFALTPLGEYAFGLTDTVPEYDPYVVEKCRLDEEYPFIYVPESMSEVYAPYLKKFGRPIGPARYAVSMESFTKGIRSRKVLKDRLAHFREFVGGELPQVWRELLERIESRAQSVKVDGGYYTSLSLDSENEELLDFVLNNAYIAETCIRGENYTLFVPVDNLDVVINEFASAGYLLN